MSGGKNKCCSEIKSRIKGMGLAGVVEDWYLYREVKKSLTDKVTFEQKPERN